VLPVDVVRVFTDPDGHFGNPLGIVSGHLVPPADRQALAAHLGYSETVYVDDPSTGTVRIYTATGEMPFAGHPTVGIAWWLRSQGISVPVLHCPAGEIPVSFDGDLVSVRANTAWGSTWDWIELPTPAEVLAADPAAYPTGHTYLWSWLSEPDGLLRSRAFAPAMGAPEDEATGSAATQLTALLARNLHIIQGHGSHLHTAYLPPTHATVGGRVVAEASRTINL
jgi:predicted PhzF superfamily epimerase YddE/YHI9